MDSLRAYIIPFRNLYNGLHEYIWDLDASFFKNFESSPLREGDFKVEMQLDKQDEISTVILKIRGKFPSVCDRCLAEIVIPVIKAQQFYIKNGIETSEDPDLVYLSPEASELNVAELLYDYVCLSLPLLQRIDCEKMDDPPCNYDVLSRIQKEDELQADLSVWDILKNINKN